MYLDNLAGFLALLTKNTRCLMQLPCFLHESNRIIYQVVSMLSWMAAARYAVEKKYTGGPAGSKTAVLLVKHIRATIRLQRELVMSRRLGYSWHGCPSIAAGRGLVSACDK